MASRAAVILAAGQGTRMKSPLPKVLHPVGGRAMLDHAIDAVQAAGCERVVVVVGAHAPEVGRAVAARLGPQATAVQDPPLGTAHAVLAAAEALAGFEGDVVVTNADCPLLRPEDLQPLFGGRAAGADLALLAFEPADPALYGRVLRGPDGRVERIVEARDATPEELAVRTCYAGMLAADCQRLFGWLRRVGNNNTKREYYLTEVAALATADGATVTAAIVPERAVMGADSLVGLAAAEAVFQTRRRTELMLAGVSLRAPETVHLSWDTEIEPGAVVEPNVVFGAGVRVGAGATIRAFSHLEGATVQAGAVVGPFARLRPGADIGPKAHVGNFVEVKNATLGPGAKANHLAYIGDGEVGAKANIGAGVIFCNYDGFDKHRTVVGEGAFVGSDTALVAPVTVGAGAYIGSGSVITRDVAPDALALERSEQVEKPGWAARFREKKRAAQAEKPGS
jgi:bifunctional UDP-N-acetylglucosamine pyrophosphorylase/glucosamine-1-phosphate N-acetyltransferase